MAEGIILIDDSEAFVGFLGQEVGDRHRTLFRIGGNPEGVRVAGLPGQGFPFSPVADVEDLFLVGQLRQRQTDVRAAPRGYNFGAVQDVLSRLPNGDIGLILAVLHDDLDLLAQNAALLVYFVRHELDGVDIIVTAAFEGA
jgi:hypothetical protein